MEIILDALDNLSLSMKNTEAFGLPNRYPYLIDDVNNLFHNLDNRLMESTDEIS